MSVTLCIRPGDDGAIVAISGEVDVCAEDPLQQSLLQVIRGCGARLTLDVSGVSFMDCAGLRALLATRRRAEMRGGFLRLIATSAAVRRIIELTGAQETLAMEQGRGPARPLLKTNGPDARHGQYVCLPLQISVHGAQGLLMRGGLDLPRPRRARAGLAGQHAC